MKIIATTSINVNSGVGIHLSSNIFDENMDFLNLSNYFDGEALELKKSDEVYPVTLAMEWPRLTRLLILSCLAVIGSVGNIFMISSVMVEDHLKKAGSY